MSLPPLYYLHTPAAPGGVLWHGPFEQTDIYERGRRLRNETGCTVLVYAARFVFLANGGEGTRDVLGGRRNFLTQANS